MAISCCATGALSIGTPAIASRRSRKWVSSRITDLAPLCGEYAQQGLTGAAVLLGAGFGPAAFSYPPPGVAARCNVAKECKGAVSGKPRTLKMRRKVRMDRLVVLSVSSSSSPSPSSVSYSDEAPEASLEHGGGGNGFSGRGGGHGGGGGGGDNGSGGPESSGPLPGESADAGGILGSFLRGWNARVRADPQFAFKVLMEEVIGVGMCVLGDMATRPNFGLDELDLVFSTLVVGSILNFTLMYMLAPTAAAGMASAKLPGIFASSPAGHMFESGSYSLLERFGTFVYKGTQFAGVGFFAGLVGTGISSSLISARKRVDPTFVSQNASPPVLLNAATWAAHMGFSSNARYQSLNGLEFALAKTLSPGTFKLCVPFLRGFNNVLGGATFVALARFTGSQPSDSSSSPPTSPQSDESIPLVEPAIPSA